MKKKILSIAQLLFFLGLGVFLIWYIVQGLSEKEVIEVKRAFRDAKYEWVFLSCVIGIFAHVSRSYRWNMLINTMGYKPRISNTFAAVMIGYLANYAFPRLGEVTRCGILNKYENVPLNKGIGTVIAERAVDLLTLVILFVITLILQFYKFKDIIAIKLAAQKQRFVGMVYGENLYIFLLVVAVIALLFILLYAFRHKFKGMTFYDRVISIIKGFVDGMKSIKDLQNIKLFLFHTFFIWFCYFFMIYVCFFSFEETKELGFHAAMAVLVFGSIGIIAVQGGIGAYQAIVMGLLVLYGIESSIGFAFGWLVWGAQTVLNAIIGALFLILLPVMNNRWANAKVAGHTVQNR